MPHKVDGESIIGGALALIASFAWRDAITETIDAYYPVDAKNSKNLQVKFIYAIVVTLFVFLIFALYIGTISTLTYAIPPLHDYMDASKPRWGLPSLQKMEKGPSIKWHRGM
jgi:hypothetical protein